MGEMKHISAIAKITAPKVSGIARRERPLGLLDKNGSKPVVWLSSPAGSGKTTLAASYLDSRRLPCLWYQCDEGDADLSSFFYYMGLAAKKANPRKKRPMPLLTPEYLQGIPAFTRRYFEELFSRLKSSDRSNGFFIVFDNYHEVPEYSEFHEMLAHGLDVIPEGIKIIIVGRKEPPPQFARLRANNGLALVGWNDIRFTLDEVREALKPWRRGRCLDLDCPGPEVLHEKTGGWAAGLRLALEAAEPQREIVRNSVPGSPVCHCIEGFAWRDDVFDYFAGEIFDRADKSIRTFLLKTSFLPSMTASMAAKISGNPHWSSILERLAREHYFTDRLTGREHIYRYHPLFKEFLMHRAENAYSQEELRKIMKNAADILKASGHDDEAAELYIKSGEQAELAMLVISMAEKLKMQGRYGTLKKWLSAISSEIMDADPRLLYWRGVSCMDRDMVEGRSFFEKAFRAFDASGDTTGAMLAWAGSVETIIVYNDSYADVAPWVEWLDRRMGTDISFPSSAVEAQVVHQMMNALTVHYPHNPRLPLWRQRTEAIIRDSSLDVNQRLFIATYLVSHYILFGDDNKAGDLLRELRPLIREGKTPPLLFIIWRFIEAVYNCFGAISADECLHNVNTGLDTADRTGIHVIDPFMLYVGAQAYLMQGRPDAAEDFLGRISSLPVVPSIILAEYHLTSAGACLLREDAPAALQHFRIASDLLLRAGDRIMTVVAFSYAALLLIESGEMKEAGECLQKARGENAGAAHLCRHALLLAEAYLAFASGNEAKGYRKTAELIALGMVHGTMPLPYCPRRALSFVCAKALEADAETDYAREIIKRHNLVCEAYHAEAWPYPVKIYTLGRFEIIKDGKPLVFSGKAQKKPIEMLKAIIAGGCRDVPAERIMDALWEDADGDSAYSALRMTLMRLRRLLGGDKYIEFQNGRLTINPRYCFVDSLASKKQAFKTTAPTA